MKSVKCALIAAWFAVAAAGCQSNAELCVAPAGGSSALLFDPVPGFPTAEDMAWRADWPSVDSAYYAGESVYYLERFIDMQYSSPFGWNNDRTYRRFSTVRSGFGVR